MSTYSKKYGRNFQEQDVWDVLKNVEDDFNVWDVEVTVRRSKGYPFKVQATCWLKNDIDAEIVTSHEFFTTERYPNLYLPMWKAASSLYVALERKRDGLPPLL